MFTAATFVNSKKVGHRPRMQQRLWLSKPDALQKGESCRQSQYMGEKLKNMLHEKREQSTMWVPSFQPRLLMYGNWLTRLTIGGKGNKSLIFIRAPFLTLYCAFKSPRDFIKM